MDLQFATLQSAQSRAMPVDCPDTGLAATARRKNLRKTLNGLGNLLKAGYFVAMLVAIQLGSSGLW
jgi:hypothetical protein